MSGSVMMYGSPTPWDRKPLPLQPDAPPMGPATDKIIIASPAEPHGNASRDPIDEASVDISMATQHLARALSQGLVATSARRDHRRRLIEAYAKAHAALAEIMSLLNEIGTT